MTPVPTILYVDCRPDDGIERRRLAGMRRYAAALDWGVETLEHGDCSRSALNVRMARATELLAGSDIPVSAVAQFCGFKTELAF